jgi:protein-tyrosine kinase
MSRIENALEKASSLQARMPRRPDRSSSVVAEPAPVLVAPTIGTRNPGIVTLTKPESPAAEEYRKLKTAVLRQALSKNRQPVIVVTSCVSGEGKSLTSLNLAVSIAEEVDRSVLLIDTDMRRPSLAEYLGISVQKGLSDCLRDGTDASSVVVGTGISRLNLLPAGPSVRNPVELLSSPAMPSLLANLRRSAAEQILVIDTPPALPFAETPIVGSMADGIVLVVKEATVTVDQLKEALELIGESRLLGVVFNDVLDGSRNEQYQHYYRYYAGQRRREEA